ncbi:MAG: FeoA family protein [candidate division WOR-3 bacterium]|nr:FeoA family protein [candidate division WOR-3 bacterium]
MPARQQLSLADVGTGVSVRIDAIKGGRGVAGRLSSMGLVPGTEVQVISGSRGGPVIVGLRGCRIAIGCGMANKIMVEPVSDTARTVPESGQCSSAD